MPPVVVAVSIMPPLMLLLLLLADDELVASLLLAPADELAVLPVPLELAGEVLVPVLGELHALSAPSASVANNANDTSFRFI